MCGPIIIRFDPLVSPEPDIISPTPVLFSATKSSEDDGEAIALSAESSEEDDELIFSSDDSSEEEDELEDETIYETPAKSAESSEKKKKEEDKQICIRITKARDHTHWVRDQVQAIRSHRPKSTVCGVVWCCVIF